MRELKIQLPILLSKKTTKRGGGGQKLPVLRQHSRLQHSLWTAPNTIMTRSFPGFPIPAPPNSCKSQKIQLDF